MSNHTCLPDRYLSYRLEEKKQDIPAGITCTNVCSSAIAVDTRWTADNC